MRFVLIGLLAGLTSGLFGVGGGITMVPLLVWACRFDQKGAHATSLGAIIPIAAAGAVVFASDSALDLTIAALLAGGSLVGAPLGAKALASWQVSRVRIAFGIFNVLVGLTLLFS